MTIGKTGLFLIGVLVMPACSSFSTDIDTPMGIRVRINGERRDGPPPGAPKRKQDFEVGGTTYEHYDMDCDGSSDVGREKGSDEWWDIDVMRLGPNDAPAPADPQSDATPTPVAPGGALTPTAAGSGRLAVALHRREPLMSVPMHAIREANERGWTPAMAHHHFGTASLTWNQPYDNPRGAFVHAAAFRGIEDSAFYLRLLYNPKRSRWPELHDIGDLRHKIGILDAPDGSYGQTPFVEIHLEGTASEIATALVRFGFDEIAGHFRGLPPGRIIANRHRSEITVETPHQSFGPFPIQR